MGLSIATRRGFAVIIAQVLLLVLAGCGEEEEPREGQVEGLRYRLAPDTVWLRPGAPATVLAQTQDRMVLSALPRGLEAGKVLVSTVGTGALRKVRAVRREGPSFVVETGPATLAEAFEELELDQQQPLGRAQLGELVSDVPGVSFEWVREPSAQARAEGLVPTLEPTTLKVTFKNAELSSNGINVDGEVFLRLNPVLELRTRPGKGPSAKVESFEAGARPELSGTLKVSSTYGGSVSGDKTWFDKVLGVRVMGPLVFVPKLRIGSGISGSASGAFDATYSVQSSAVALTGWTGADGWYTRGEAAPLRTGRVEEAKATLQVQADLLTVELRFDLYGLAGPYAETAAYARVTGEFDLGPDNREGVLVTVAGGLSLEGGLGTDFKQVLGEGFEDAGWTAFSVDVPLLTVFEKFFPYEGTSSVVVGDNGPAAEDIFEVVLDGILLGQTQRGGTGQFRVTDLRPGRHLLAVTCTDDGWEGADIGTLGITLGDGLTFSDGSQALSDTLSMYETRTYELVVPAGSGVGAGGTPPPMPRSASVEKLH